jgi:activator of 2-hydroxyglutaryl-CoA dehydratase
LSYVGINIGALTVKVVAVRPNTRSVSVMSHQGRPLEILEQLLAMPDFADGEYFGVSGHLGHISEFAAIQRALHEVRERAPGEFDAVASLGGESFLVYTLAAGRVINVLSHNKCAAGSGEFFVQLIGRMGLDINAAI